tara:strand:+ start:76 stop:591 length:516 start_codon:yes stop_codon:yes gene_type:complete
MTYKNYPLIAGILFFFSACVSSPFLELNSRDNFQLEPATEFSISLNKENLPVEMDPILIENLGEAAKNYLEGTGNLFSSDASIIIELNVASKDKIKVDDFRYYGYPMYRSYLYDSDRINTVPEFYLRISIRDTSIDKTLWTGLTKWRKGSSYSPSDMSSAELLVENLLINL